jgi:hypothetical protein
MLAEIATVSAGVAAREPEKLEPSDIDTEKTPTVVPAGELSGRDVVAEVKVTPVGLGGGGGGSTRVTAIAKVAAVVNSPFFPYARTRTE